MTEFRARDGALLHADEHGTAGSPPLVVLPGGPARHPDYLGTFEPIVGCRRILVLHPRGVGGSAAAPVRSFAEQADDVEDLRRHLGAESVDVLAHATGCRTALVHAARYPERVSRLLLVSPATGWLGVGRDDRDEIAARRLGSRWLGDALEAAILMHDETDAHRRIELYRRAAPLGWSTWDERAQAHERAATWFPDAFAGFFTTVDATALRRALTLLRCPVMIVGGEDDALVGVEPLAELSALFPSGSLAVIEGSGHYPWIEAPAEFALALRAFVSEAPSAPPTGRRRPSSRD